MQVGLCLNGVKFSIESLDSCDFRARMERLGERGEHDSFNISTELHVSCESGAYTFLLFPGLTQFLILNLGQDGSLHLGLPVLELLRFQEVTSLLGIFGSLVTINLWFCTPLLQFLQFACIGYFIATCDV